MNLVAVSGYIALVLTALALVWNIASKRGDQRITRDTNSISREAFELQQWRDETRLRIEKLEEDRDKLTVENRELRGQLVAIQTNVTKLLSQQQDSLAIATEAQKERAEAVQKVVGLETQVDNLGADLIKVQNENARLQSDLAAMRTENAQLRAEIEELRREIARKRGPARAKESDHA